MLRSSPCAALLLASVILGGCREAEIVTYRVPKDPERAAPAGKMASTNIDSSAGAAATTAAEASAASGAPMAAPAMPPAGGVAAAPLAAAAAGDLTWTAPAHWKAGAAGAMRRATYIIPGEGSATADLSISLLSGAAGGEVANINRWRGQVGLPPLTEAEINASTVRVEHNGLKMGIVDLANPGGSPTRIVGAIVPHGRDTWFFKVTGPDALVAKDKPEFLKFLQTVKAGN